MDHVGQHRRVSQGEECRLEGVVGPQLAALTHNDPEGAVAQIFHHHLAPGVPAQLQVLARQQVGYLDALPENGVARGRVVAVVLAEVVIIAVAYRTRQQVQRPPARDRAHAAILPKALHRSEPNRLARAPFYKCRQV